MTKSNFAFRFQPGLRANAERLAQAYGVTLDQYVNTAVVEKIARDETTAFFAERARGGSADDLIAFLEAAPDREPIFETDILPGDAAP